MDYNVQIITLIAELQSDRVALKEQNRALQQELDALKEELEVLKESLALGASAIEDEDK